MGNRFQINPKASDHRTHARCERLWDTLLEAFQRLPMDERVALFEQLSPEGDLHDRFSRMDNDTLIVICHLAFTALMEIQRRDNIAILQAAGDGDDGEG